MAGWIVTTILLVSVWSWGLPTAAHAQEEPLAPRVGAPADSYETPSGLALGTGVRAAGSTSAALAYNPANLPLSGMYHIEAVTGYQVDPQRWQVGAAVVDAVTSTLAAGFSARGVVDAQSEDYSGADLRLGLGMPITKHVGIGLTGRYLNLNPRNRGMLTPTQTDQTKGFTVDGAIRISPTEWLHLAGLAYNIVDRKSSLAPRTFGGSAAVNFGPVTVGADALADTTSFRTTQWLAGGGVEYRIAGNIPLRAGYRLDAGRDVHAVSGGIGYLGEVVSVDLSLRQDVDGGNDTWLLAGVRVQVE